MDSSLLLHTYLTRCTLAYLAELNFVAKYLLTYVPG